MSFQRNLSSNRFTENTISPKQYNMTALGELELNQKDLKVKWKIRNFFSLTEVVYSSSIFSFANQSWCLRLYPNGNKFDTSYTEGYFSVYLRRKSPGPSVKIEFSFYLKTADKKRALRTRQTSVFENPETGEGSGRYLERTKLMERKSELMPSDVLTIICSLKCPRNAKNASSESEWSSDEEDAANKRPLSKRKGIEILSDDLKQVFLDGRGTDTVLKADGKDFKVHKVILVARSPVFASMFQHDLAEKKSNEVDIPDCTADSFEVFLNYLYTGSVETLSISNVYNVYYASDKYQVDDLKKKCIKFMMKNISVETFCDVIDLSLRHGESELQKTATDFFCQNVRDIIKTVQWLQYMDNNATQANELLIKFFKV